MQAENAAEWGKRERLETEKLSMDRENKKLRGELRDFQERIERKGRPLTNSDAELRHLQQELLDKNKVSEYKLLTIILFHIPFKIVVFLILLHIERCYKFTI